uniref:Uncharacterized protein n=1 Tax=Rhizophora mucronata TaxID=61149 RepID=A0A2P2N3T8_RHIMU
MVLNLIKLLSMPVGRDLLLLIDACQLKICFWN